MEEKKERGVENENSGDKLLSDDDEDEDEARGDELDEEEESEDVLLRLLKALKTDFFVEPSFLPFFLASIVESHGLFHLLVAAVASFSVARRFVCAFCLPWVTTGAPRQTKPPTA